MKDLRVIIRVKNNLLVKLRESMSFNQMQMAEYLKVGKCSYGDLENLVKPPRNKKGEWSPIALKIAKNLKMLVEDVFPESLQNVKKNKIEKEINTNNLIDYYQTTDVYKQISSPEKKHIDRNIKNEIKKTIETLTPREQEVINHRYGFNGYSAVSLKKCGEIMGICGTRVQQIEAKGIRKLRHPSRRNVLKNAINKK